MTTADASNGDGDKPKDGEAANPEETADARPEAPSGEKKSKLSRNAAVGVGIGIGSAALVAALLYASRYKPGQGQD
jgi:hypothetical protein